MIGSSSLRQFADVPGSPEEPTSARRGPDPAGIRGRTPPTPRTEEGIQFGAGARRRSRRSLPGVPRVNGSGCFAPQDFPIEVWCAPHPPRRLRLPQWERAAIFPPDGRVSGEPGRANSPLSPNELRSGFFHSPTACRYGSPLRRTAGNTAAARPGRASSSSRIAAIGSRGSRRRTRARRWRWAGILGWARRRTPVPCRCRVAPTPWSVAGHDKWQRSHDLDAGVCSGGPTAGARWL